MATIRQQKNKCLICGFDRVTDRCHLIPQRVLYVLPDTRVFNQMKEFEGVNIVRLCKNHHALLDKHLLNKDEFETIRPFMVKAHEMLMSEFTRETDILDSGVHHKSKMVKWCDQFNTYLTKIYA